MKTEIPADVVINVFGFLAYAVFTLFFACLLGSVIYLVWRRYLKG